MPGSVANTKTKPGTKVAEAKEEEGEVLVQVPRGDLLLLPKEDDSDDPRSNGRTNRSLLWSRFLRVSLLRLLLLLQ